MRRLLQLAALFVVLVPNAHATLTFVDKCSAATSSCTVPAHQVGDLFIAAAGRDGSTSAPSLPAGWTQVSNLSIGSGGTSSAVRITCKVATTNAETATGFTNAGTLTVLIYRGQDAGLTAVCASGILGTPVTFTSTATTTVTYSAVTNRDANSWNVGIGFSSAASNMSTAPSGMTNRTSAGTGPMLGAHDTNGGVSSWSSTNVTANTSGRVITAVVEIKAPGAAGAVVPKMTLLGVGP
jgi:hypothetical protein